jgi:uncharacterized protein
LKKPVFVFGDPNLLSISGEEHSAFEERWISLGMIKKLKIIVVVHTSKKYDKIRIISARKATKSEEKIYIERSE